LADAGRRLAELHVGYESVEPYPLEVQLKPGGDPSSRETWRVTMIALIEIPQVCSLKFLTCEHRSV
jgi:predicted helicase